MSAQLGAIKQVQCLSYLAGCLSVMSLVCSVLAVPALINHIQNIKAELDQHLHEFNTLSSDAWRVLKEDPQAISPLLRRTLRQTVVNEGPRSYNYDLFPAPPQLPLTGRGARQQQHPANDNGSPSCACNPLTECPAGEPGKMGPKGERGMDAPPGENGIPGKDAENVKIVASVGCFNCPRGRPGGQGTTGRAGVRGMKGPQGVRGQDGRTMRAGFPGEMGNPGPIGRPGRAGPAGKQGMSAAWPIGVRGPKGPTGEYGEVGYPGSRGVPGRRGAYGRAGAPGPPGLQGAAGIDGLRGPPGGAAYPGRDALYCECPPTTN